ncbi:23S rRNA (pseudouridine(1915)-N(3))-methyltransferase RlmH [Parvibaculum sp.]|uniref:23S rRNA (pseudouridine(1915)-N(3))-methyltransferase RlmH n=1 Tax=Parvibaculum sp. TaxID=2024848 RepID=UPI002728FE5C|nr:23S rRNA (pseudouridine(1915)-N(3))-methyltransferase RlmH [Parvibaculum sp.]MDO9126795.1 23S rRNA (pseudouridine(1915)-N(3))-methyltransferase RlmH [Parvibaculum sp.]MDP1627337.1 23S rRNA (pseudouridine(1915)-N(3))-methyltransferase RlmH [Parvibaculum sp.]MDP2151992.1 23S rRNA (pseudouridine(1915)-N(3))-methyltransferase RlmH [Parvibaculum sp.]MDP3328858.1 23S rRNA (pseudouridine(1915)-N(3))-methyltransferase RlmH [Parvibaculum sp.]
MRIQICAVGRLRAGPEKLLLDDYTSRLDATGRGIGLSVLPLSEVEEKRRLEDTALMEREAELLLAAAPKGALIIALDERGRVETSEAFAKRIGTLRDNGTADVAFLIGGANGLAPAIRDRAAHVMAFGAMTWPHMFVRVMLAEQLYRAATILSGHPYHRA